MQLLVGLFGVGATVLLLGIAASSVSVHTASVESLLSACRAWVLPRATFPQFVVLALGSLAFAVLGLALRSAVRQLHHRRRFFAGLADLRSAPVGPAGTMLFACSHPQAFCAGLLRPRIYLSDATIALLSAEELAAVLAHEAHHARYRDPLRIFFARTLSDALFFLPVLRRLAERYAALAELAADAAAVRQNHSDPAPLASALLAFDRAADPAVVGIAPERVDHLLGERPRWQLPLALLAWAVVVVGALVIIALRTAEATVHSTIDLPLLASELCMVMMAAVPLIMGAGALLGSRRLLGHLRA